MTTSSITNEPRRTMACNDITLPINSSQSNSFLRRRTQQQTFNGQLDKSSSASSSTKSPSINENSAKMPATTFSLLRQHSSPTNSHGKVEKSTYDNLTHSTMQTEPMTLERKPSCPVNKKSLRHPTNDSLASDAYDNFPDKNGYDNYPMIRKAIASANESEGR